MFKSFLYNNKTKKVIYYLILFFLAFYLFSVTAFDEIYGLHYTNYFAVIFLTLLVVTYEILYLKKVYLSRQMLFPLFFVIYVCFITICFGTFTDKLFTMCNIFISFLVIYQGVKIINNGDILVYSLVCSALAYLLFFFFMNFQEIISLDFLNDRMGGNIGNLNAVGENLLLYASLFAFFILDKKRWYCSLFSIPFLLFAFFTGSKMVFFGIGLLVITIIIILFRKKRILLFISISLFLTIGILMLQLPLFNTIRERLISMILTLVSGDGGASTNLRLLYSEVGVYLSGQNLFFGLGAEGFKLNTSFETYSHNNFVEILCNFGLFGFILFYFPMIKILLNTRHHLDSKILLLPFFMILFYFVVGFANIYYYSKLLFILYAFAFGSIEEDAFTYKKKLVI